MDEDEAVEWRRKSLSDEFDDIAVLVLKLQGSRAGHASTCKWYELRKRAQSVNMFGQFQLTKPLLEKRREFYATELGTHPENRAYFYGVEDNHSARALISPDIFPHRGISGRTKFFAQRQRDFYAECTIGRHFSEAPVLKQDDRCEDVRLALKLVGDIRRQRLIAILNPAKKLRLMWDVLVTGFVKLEKILLGFGNRTIDMDYIFLNVEDAPHLLNCRFDEACRPLTKFAGMTKKLTRIERAHWRNAKLRGA
ncbi:hypothetical protein EDE09_11332 [Neorhizobium sp. S3-V5DH]|nr:hypothetical protein EDE09_11332 [Neorhizobium sp. S3-V5DH]